uniref:MucBP domain-containing protein n=1 Tax=Lacticaseibacillus porcinae TaxID=1123687 RepID=UPI000F7665B5
GGYTYQGLGTGSAALNGKFTAGAQTITLVYQQNHGEEVTPTNAGALTIKYVDQNGKSIQADTVKSGYVGNDYGVTPSTIGGYTYQGLGKDSAALNGKFTAGAQTITLVYQQNHGEETTPTTAGNLTIKYVDQNGNSIRDDDVKNGYVGNGYGVTPATIGDYTYQGLGTGSAALNGKFTADAQTITLVYQQNHGEETTPTAAGDLTVKYVDQNGNSIRNDDVKSGYVGNGYGVTPATINGYTYQSLGQDSAALSGNFTENAQTITLVYRRDTTVPGKTTGTDTTKPHDGTSTTTDTSTSSSHGTLPDTNGGATASTTQKHQSLPDTNRDAKTATTQNRRTLPQTGEQTKRSAMIIGTLLLSMIGIIGIWKHQRKA